MKFTVPQIKPRNLLVASLHLRGSGSHKATSKSKRQLLRRELQRELIEHAKADQHGP